MCLSVLDLMDRPRVFFFVRKVLPEGLRNPVLGGLARSVVKSHQKALAVLAFTVQNGRGGPECSPRHRNQSGRDWPYKSATRTKAGCRCYPIPVRRVQAHRYSARLGNCALMCASLNLDPIPMQFTRFSSIVILAQPLLPMPPFAWPTLQPVTMRRGCNW